MNKILFIVPPYISFDSFVNPSAHGRTVVKNDKTLGNPFTDMPLGILSMSAYVKKNSETQTKLIDYNIILNKLKSFEYDTFYDLFLETISEQKWIDYNPDIIGISALFTPSYYSMIDITKICKKIFPKAIIFAGGGVPTNMYNEIFNDTDCFDALCYGEGEKPLLELVKSNNKLDYIKNSPSWITKEKIKNKETFKHDFIENLDEIPFYDYKILNPDDYGLNPAITAYASVDSKNTNFHIMTSRGCPHHCCFCSSHTVHGRKMRYFSLKRVKEDFTRLRDEYGANTIVFQDDHLMADRKRALAVIDIINDLKMTAVFQNGLALYALDREMLEALQSAGLHQLVLPIESGSERVLRDIMHKPLNLSIAKKVADDCKDLGIYTNINILIGLPGETKQDIQDAKEFLKTIGANWYIILCATPLVGSEMFDICKEKGYLKGDYIGCEYKKAIVETEDFTADYIQEIGYLMNLELNFIHNNDFLQGHYEIALKGFENAIKAKNDHALAYYFAAKCYKKLNNEAKYLDYKNKYEKIIKESETWRKYVNEFKLTPLEHIVEIKI